LGTFGPIYPERHVVKRHPIQWFWKALTLFGTILLVVVQFVTPDLSIEGRALLGVLTLGWLAMFLFTELDV
jgi:hypothetical protein